MTSLPSPHNSVALPFFYDLSFCCFDLETTGPDPFKDDLLEIGLVKIFKGKIQEKKHFLLKPKGPIPDFIQKLTGITATNVKNAPYFLDCAEEILSFLQGSILVAHNISFDVPFLENYLKRHNIEVTLGHKICTQIMAKYVFPGMINTNLTALSQFFGITLARAHRALDDAIATAHIFLSFLSFFHKRKARDIKDLYYPKKNFEWNQIHCDSWQQVTKFESLPFPGFVHAKGINGEILGAIPFTQLKINNILNYFPTLTQSKKISLTFSGHFLIAFSSSIGLIPRPLWENLYNFFLQEERSLYFNNEKNRRPPEESSALLESKEFPFILVPHLFPGQLSFLDLGVLGEERADKIFTFKFPEHQKKFFTVLRAKNKKRPSFLSNNWKNLFRELSSNRKDILYLPKQDISEKVLSFTHELKTHHPLWEAHHLEHLLKA